MARPTHWASTGRYSSYMVDNDVYAALSARGAGIVVQEGKLSVVLSEFARTLLTDFPIQAILDHLVERIVEALPVTAVGITLISPGSAPHYIAASDESALAFERLQTEFGQGPCRLAYESGDAVTVPDLGKDHRFPLFTAAARPAGSARWTCTGTSPVRWVRPIWERRRRWRTWRRPTCSTPRPARRPGRPPTGSGTCLLYTSPSPRDRTRSRM